MKEKNVKHNIFQLRVIFYHPVHFPQKEQRLSNKALDLQSSLTMLIILTLGKTLQFIVTQKAISQCREMLNPQRFSDYKKII